MENGPQAGRAPQRLYGGAGELSGPPPPMLAHSCLKANEKPLSRYGGVSEEPTAPTKRFTSVAEHTRWFCLEITQ